MVIVSYFVCLFLSNGIKANVWAHVNIGFDQCFVRVLCFFGFELRG